MNYHLSVNDGIEIYPLVPLAVCLIVGIVLGERVDVEQNAIMTAMLGIVALAMLFIKTRRLGGIMSLGYLAFFVALGMLITKWTAERQDFAETGEYEDFHVIVKTEPTKTKNGVRMLAECVDGRMAGKDIQLRIKYDEGEDTTQELLGKCLLVRAKVWHPKNFGNSRFDYSLYLKSHGIWATATAYPGKWKVEKNHNFDLSPIGNMKIHFAAKRRAMVERLRSLGMDSQAFAVTAAMSLGDKSEVSRVTSNVYSLAGTSHVLALSGLHLSIVFGLFAVFGGRWRRSVVAVNVSVFALWTYVLLAGSPISMIRAAIMLSVSLLVGVSGRNGITLNTLSFSAILILLANPFAVYDVGFQLSFAAVAFLGAFASDIGKIVPEDFLLRHRILKWCWQITVSSTVAQLGTAPLVAYHFGRVPLLFLPANFIAIPAATALLYLAVAFFLLLWLPWVSEAIGWLLSVISSTLNGAMTYIASIRWSSLTIEGMDAAYTVGMYMIALGVLLILQRIGQSSSDRVQRLRAWGETRCTP